MSLLCAENTSIAASGAGVYRSQGEEEPVDYGADHKRDTVCARQATREGMASKHTAKRSASSPAAKYFAIIIPR